MTYSITQTNRLCKTSKTFTAQCFLSNLQRENKAYFRGQQIFPKSSSHVEILSVKTATRKKFHTEDPQILGVTVQNAFARGVCNPALGSADHTFSTINIHEESGVRLTRWFKLSIHYKGIQTSRKTTPYLITF